MTQLQEAMRGLLNEAELELLPSGFKRVGHVAIISLPRELADREQDIAQGILNLSGVRTVMLREGEISGRHRTPKLRVIAGDQNTETVHVENGCRFKLDVAEVMFSAGNVHERKRLIALVSPGEVITDLFAGIGQFSIPIAVHTKPALINSVELNRTAFGYLLENVRMNKVGHIVKPIWGDCAQVAPRGMADRVIMGIIHVTHSYLPLALEALKPEGGVIHYHETVPSKIRFERPITRIEQAASGREVEVIGKRVVKRYSPGVDHVVVDARVGPS